MARGVYRDGNLAFVDYSKTARAPIPRQTYEDNGYEPPFDDLPTREQHEAADA